MTMTAIVAIALGLTPAQPGRDFQKFQYSEKGYADLIGHYDQIADSRGKIHLRGSYRGKAFDLAVSSNGRVEGTVGDYDLALTVREEA